MTFGAVIVRTFDRRGKQCVSDGVLDSEDCYIRRGGDVERSLGFRVLVGLSGHGCEHGDVEDDASRGEGVGRCERMVRYVEDAAGEGEVGYEDVGSEADT